MAEFNFPSNPSIGDTWVVGGVTWQWNGSAWVKFNPISYGTGTTTITNAVLISTTTNSIDTASGALIVRGGVGINKDVYIGGIISSIDTTPASTNAGGEGSLAVQGGAYVGDNLIVMSTAFSTATGLNNALYVEGGAYVKDHFTVEGTTLFKDSVTFGGTATYVLSSNTVYTDNILELHIPPGGINDVWTLDDGKDIGIRIHYYETTNTEAAFVFANDSKSFEFYKSGAEGTSTFSNGVYGGLKAGNLWLVDTSATSNTYTGALRVDGGVGIAGGIYVGSDVNGGTVTARNLTDTSVAVAGAGGQLHSYAGLTYNTGTNILHGTITTASNVSAGTSGAVLYQSAPGTTDFVSLGTATYVLTSNGTSPYWAPIAAATTVTSAINIAQGAAGQIPFQEDIGSTKFSSALTFSTASNTLNVDGGSTSSGHISVSGNITSSSTVFTEYLKVNGNITVGSVVANTGVSVLTSNNLNLTTYTKTGITGTGQVSLDSYSGADYRSSKYFIQAVDGSDVHVTEVSVFHNGTTAYKTEYGYHYSNGALGTFDAVYSATNVVLTFTPTSATNMDIKVVRWSLTP